MAVKKYSLKNDRNKYCSTHTQVWEMASTGQGKTYSDTVLVDEKLMEMIEKLFSALKCSKYVITSGYRTPQHDKIVGGNGSGQHTKGTAVDCCFYDAKGKIISSKEVSCIAQDLGFKGIANISSKYQAIHLDMRTSGTYKGNEVYGTSTVTKDFYAYYGIHRNALREKYGLSVDEKPSVIYQVWDDVKNCWLPEVTDLTDYAGLYGHDVCAVYARLTSGNIFYKVHYTGGDWLPEAKNREDYAGLFNKPIDGLMMRTDTGKTIKYAVHLRRENRWLPFVSGYDADDFDNGYAGIIGQEIDGIKIYIE